jgi:hypothetical protein
MMNWKGQERRHRSRWSHDLWHELSSLARTLGSWVRIPLKAWMYGVCAFILCLCCPVRRADHSFKESYRLCKKDYETEAEARAQQRAVEPLMNGWMNKWNEAGVTQYEVATLHWHLRGGTEETTSNFSHDCCSSNRDYNTESASSSLHHDVRFQKSYMS